MHSVPDSFTTVFHFYFNPFALLYFLPAFINIILFFVILKQNFKTAVHYYCALMMLSLSIWATGQGFVALSKTVETSFVWESFSAMGWIFIPPTIFGLCMSYAEKTKITTRIKTILLLFLPAYFFLFLVLYTNLSNTQDISMYVHEYNGWIGKRGPLYAYILVPWIIVLITGGVLMMTVYLFQIKDRIRRNQALLLIAGILIPYGVSVFSELIAPVLFIGLQFSRLGSVLTTLTGILYTYDIIKYKLFILNPATVASNLISTMHESLIVINVKTNQIEYTNDVVKEVLGYSRQELENHLISEIVGSDSVKLTDDVILPIKQGTIVSSTEIVFIAKNGERIPFSISASPFKDTNGNIVSAVCVANDVRKLKELYNVTAEQKKLQVTIESISDGVLALDLDGRVSMLNTSATTLLGETRDNIIGKLLDEVVTFTTETQEKVFVDELLPKVDITVDMTILYRKELNLIHNGRKNIVLLTSSTISGGKKVGLGAIVTLQDLTKEKQLEEMKLDFVSMAAHELRTPLTSLRGYIYILMRDYAKFFDEHETVIVNRINISAHRLVGLVENLLNVTRIERGTLTTHLEPTDWVSNVKEVIDEINDQAKDKKITLTFIGPSYTIPTVPVDKLRINEVVTNLIANAINYTPAGGSITVWIEQKAGEVITHVKDSGEGIPASALPHLFTKFFRVQGKLEQGSKGTGLGLYISKSIIEKHNGRIWAESEGIGKGATFSFSLPVSLEKVAHERPGASELEPIMKSM